MRAEPSLLELCRVQPSFCKLLQTVYRLTFSYSNEVWLPLHPTIENKRLTLLSINFHKSILWAVNASIRDFLLPLQNECYISCCKLGL